MCIMASPGLTPLKYIKYKKEFFDSTVSGANAAGDVCIFRWENVHFFSTAYKH